MSVAIGKVYRDGTNLMGRARIGSGGVSKFYPIRTGTSLMFRGKDCQGNVVYGYPFREGTELRFRAVYRDCGEVGCSLMGCDPGVLLCRYTVTISGATGSWAPLNRSWTIYWNGLGLSGWNATYSSSPANRATGCCGILTNEGNDSTATGFMRLFQPQVVGSEWRWSMDIGLPNGSGSLFACKNTPICSSPTGAFPPRTLRWVYGGGSPGAGWISNICVGTNELIRVTDDYCGYTSLGGYVLSSPGAGSCLGTVGSIVIS